MPLLNGVDSSEKVEMLFPEAKVLQGCIYVVSKLIAPDIVQQRGDFYALHFGGDKAFAADMRMLLDLFEKAGINAILEGDIHEKVWSKFSFFSPVATYTSAYNISMGKILESAGHTNSLKRLMAELLVLAKALNVNLPSDSIEKNLLVMTKLPYETTSSMQADFAGHKPTELETITGFVVRKAKEQGIEVNYYADMYQLLRDRQEA